MKTISQNQKACLFSQVKKENLFKRMGLCFYQLGLTCAIIFYIVFLLFFNPVNAHWLNPVYAQADLSNHQETKQLQIKYIDNQEIQRIAYQKVAKKKSVTLRKNTFQRNHAQFLCWNTKADGSGENYSDQQIIQLTHSLTLYAQWQHEDGWFKEDGDWYYYQAHEPQKSGWFNLNQEWFYLDPASGQACANGIYQLPQPPFLANSTSNELATEQTAYFLFDENGRLQSNVNGMYLANNLKVVSKNTKQRINRSIKLWLTQGEVKSFPGLVQQGKDYYYFPENYFEKLLKGKKTGMFKNGWFDIAKTNDLAYPTTLGVGTFAQGKYYFDSSGKMQLYDGILTYKNTHYYLEKGCRRYAGLVQYNNHYYYVSQSGKLLTNGKYFIQKTNQLLPSGYYTFDSSGKLKQSKQAVIQSLAKDSKDEKNSVPTLTKQFGLIQKDGSYYYFDHNGQLICNKDYYIAQTNQLLPQGQYHFDLSGKLIDGNQSVNGIVKETEADWFYYENGVRTYAGLIEIAGNYYYVNSECRVIHQQNYFISKTNGLLPQAVYEFNQEGCLIQKNVQKNGIEKESDGHWYYYQAGLKTYAGVIKIGNDYYYVNSHYEVLHDTVAYASKTNQFIPSGDYRFDNEGRIVLTKSS